MKDVSYNLIHGKLAAVSYGDRHLPTVVCLHGWLDNADSFKMLAPYLKNYHLICIDFPGHGHSDHRPNGTHYHFVDWVYDLHQLVLQLDNKPIKLLGHSMGGIVSCCYAAAYPEYVSSVVCIEAAGPLSAEEDITLSQLRKAYDSRVAIETSGGAKPINPKAAVRARAQAGQFSDDIAAVLVARNVKQVEDKFYWRSDKRLRTVSPIRVSEGQARDIIKGIECPVLVINGEQGFEKVDRLINERSSCFGQLQIVKTAGGHHFHMENPQNVADHVLKFWENTQFSCEKE